MQAPVASEKIQQVHWQPVLSCILILPIDEIYARGCLKFALGAAISCLKVTLQRLQVHPSVNVVYWTFC